MERSCDYKMKMKANLRKNYEFTGNNNEYYKTDNVSSLNMETNSNVITNLRMNTDYSSEKSQNEITKNKKENNCGVINIQPENCLKLNNVEIGKLYSEKIVLKNLMTFPVIIKIRSSDSRKLEIKDKVIKLNQNQKFELPIKIKFDYNCNTNANTNNLFLFLSSEFFEIKYAVYIQMMQKEVKSKSVHFQTEKKESSNNNTINNLSSISNSKLRRKNLIDKYECKKSGEWKKNIYEDFLTQFEMSKNNSDNIYEIFNSLPVDTNLNSFTGNTSRKVSEEFITKQNISNISRSNFNEKFSFEKINDFSYVGSGRTIFLIEENRDLKIKLENIMKKFKDFENIMESYANMFDRDLDIKLNNNPQELFENNSSKGYLNYKSELSDLLTESNYLVPESQVINDAISFNKTENKHKHFKHLNDMSVDEQGSIIVYKIIEDNNITDQMLNSIKERFVEIIHINCKENKTKVNVLLSFMDITSSILTSYKEQLLYLNSLIPPFNQSNNSNENNYNKITHEINYDMNTRLCLKTNLYSEFFEEVRNLENIIKTSKENFARESNTNITLFDEKKLLKNLLTFSDHPYLTREQIDKIYKEIQNTNLLTNELNNYQLENKKLICEHSFLKDELNKFTNIIDDYRKKIKNLEIDLDNFENDLITEKKECSIKNEIIEKLNQEINLLKQSQLNNAETSYQDEDYNSGNQELFELLSNKDKELLEIRSQLIIQENINSNLKKVLLKKKEFSNEERK